MAFTKSINKRFIKRTNKFGSALRGAAFRNARVPFNFKRK